MEAVPVGAYKHSPALADWSEEHSLVDISGHPVLNRLVPRVQNGFNCWLHLNAVFVNVVNGLEVVGLAIVGSGGELLEFR